MGWWNDSCALGLRMAGLLLLHWLHTCSVELKVWKRLQSFQSCFTFGGLTFRFHQPPFIGICYQIRVVLFLAFQPSHEHCHGDEVDVRVGPIMCSPVFWRSESVNCFLTLILHNPDKFLCFSSNSWLDFVYLTTVIMLEIYWFWRLMLLFPSANHLSVLRKLFPCVHTTPNFHVRHLPLRCRLLGGRFSGARL